jgi:hypothetical protein
MKHRVCSTPASSHLELPPVWLQKVLFNMLSTASGLAAPNSASSLADGAGGANPAMSH